MAAADPAPAAPAAAAAEPFGVFPVVTTNYHPTGRDPFLAPGTRQTLVEARQVDGSGAVLNQAIRQIVEPTLEAVRTNCRVNGISVPGGDQPSYALINNRPFRAGDLLPLPVDENTLNKVIAAAALYNVPIRADQHPGRSVLWLEVTRVSLRGVELRLPGFRSSLTELAYQKNFELEPPPPSSPAHR